MNADIVHNAFGLTYASWLVLPRVIMEAMPAKWQRDFIDLVDELNQTFDWEPQGITFTVQGRFGTKFVQIPEVLSNYRHPKREAIESLRIKRDAAKVPPVVYDMHDVPIYPGDLLRSFHFTGARNKRWYLYHTAVNRNGSLYMVPVAHLEPTQIGGGGDCWLHQKMADTVEVIQGYGPGKCLDYTERPKRVQSETNTN